MLALPALLWVATTAFSALEQAVNVARNAVLAAGWPQEVTGVTLNRFCGSGCQAINFAATLGYTSDTWYLNASAYYTEFSDFIYQFATGEEEDELPVQQYDQDDATFYGFDMSGGFRAATFDGGSLWLNGMFDIVEAELDIDGNDVPDHHQDEQDLAREPDEQLSQVQHPADSQVDRAGRHVKPFVPPTCAAHRTGLPVTSIPLP